MSANERFAGIARLYGEVGAATIAAASVTVVGLGGVGSWTVEALARSGVGALTLVDFDDICVSNTNRQLHTMCDTVGNQKAEVLAARVLRINPSCTVDVVSDFFTEDTAALILERPADCVVDAIDDARNKRLLVCECRTRALPLVVCGGAGGRIDPTRVRRSDLSQTAGDALLKYMRKRLRRDHGFPSQGPWGIPAVYTDEARRYPTADGDVCSAPEGGVPTRLDCADGYGAASYVTGSVGFAAAAAAIDLILDRAGR